MPHPSTYDLLKTAEKRLRAIVDDALLKAPVPEGVPGKIATSPWAERLSGAGRGLIEFTNDKLEAAASDQIISAEYANVRVTREPGWVWDTVRAEDIRTGASIRVEGVSKRNASAAQETLRASLLLHGVAAANRAFDRLVELNTYFNHSAYIRWRDEAALRLLDDEGKQLLERVDQLPVSEDAKRAAARFLARIASNDEVVDRNSQYAAATAHQYEGLFDTIESNPLTSRQREAILHDEDACLVVAGAGTGKTSTVVGKVAFLLKHDKLEPSEICLLAFNKKAATEMKQRVRQRCEMDLPVHTFHSLGLEIVAQVEGKKPSLSPIAETTTRAAALRKILDEMLASEDHRAAILRFVSYFRYPERYEWEFTERAEYLRYMQAHEPRTLKGERVKSWGELQIADWLTLHGIPYHYEAKYPVDLATKSHRQYKPDFTLVGSNSYIEYFGVDRSGSTAPEVDGAKYREGMQWKREIHEAHGSNLIEFFAFEAMEGVLLDAIRDRIIGAGIQPKPLSQDEVRQLVATPERVDPLGILLRNFLSLYKGNLCTMPALRELAHSRVDAPRMLAFLEVFERVFAQYEESVHAEGDVDFEDMIARATEYVNTGKYKPPYRRIIVDEFQDISRGRSQFVQALLRAGSDCRLFCVGDDWQSIYRFAGSDTSIMVEFSDHFGFTKRTDLDRTFRFGKPLLEVSAQFVLKNPSQIRKTMVGSAGTDGPSVTILTDESESGSLRWAMEAISRNNKSRDIATVLLLGRYRHLEPSNLSTVRREHRHLRIGYRTVHAAKGLEADYVIVLGMTARPPYSFPSEIEDDPVLGLVLPAEAGFRHAEERRIFYVALTRARKHVYLITDRAQMSPFVTELRQACYHQLVEFPVGEVGWEARCPLCKKGELLVRGGPFGPFWGCSFFPYCEGRERMCPKCEAAPWIRKPSRLECANPQCLARAFKDASSTGST